MPYVQIFSGRAIFFRLATLTRWRGFWPSAGPQLNTFIVLKFLLASAHILFEPIIILILRWSLCRCWSLWWWWWGQRCWWGWWNGWEWAPSSYSWSLSSFLLLHNFWANCYDHTTRYDHQSKYWYSTSRPDLVAACAAAFHREAPPTPQPWTLRNQLKAPPTPEHWSLCLAIYPRIIKKLLVLLIIEVIFFSLL